MRVYTIYDEVAQAAGPLFEAPNDATALRSYHRLIDDNKWMRQEDFALYCVAEWEPGTRQMVLNGSYLVVEEVTE